MKDAAESLRELKNALDTLSPQDFAAWNEWMENRLTERLRRRHEHRPPASPIRSDGEEPTDA
jgi:hypothetical protein